MIEKHIRKEFRLRNIAETRNYFLEEIIKIQLVTKKHKKNCIILNQIQHFLILASRIDGCISISAFASLLGIPIGITSSVTELKLCAIVGGIKSISQ